MKFITIKEASFMLGVSKMTLRNWDNNNKLKAFRHPINNYRVYKLEDIEKLISLIEELPMAMKRKKNEVKKVAVKHLE